MTRAVDVLVVEDNPADVELVRLAVEDFGLPHRLHFVADGEEALAFLRVAPSPPRLMLLDLNMPRLGGLGVLSTLREEGRAGPRVVVFTSSDAERDRKEALALGIAAYVVKPVQFDAFCQAVAALLSAHAPLEGEVLRELQ